MQVDWPQFLYWTYPIILLCYYGYELAITTKLARKPYPLVGRSTVLVPRFVLNLIFACKGTKVLDWGYRMVFSLGPYQSLCL